MEGLVQEPWTAWTAVERSLNSRLQELEEKSAAAEERERSVNECLSQTLSRIHVFEAQISSLRAEQTQLTKSLEERDTHVSQLQEELRELKRKQKHELNEALVQQDVPQQDIEHENAARLESETTTYIPEELIQNIQSRLLLKKGVRTSVLSKSWLHAWSTNPTLRFHDLRGKKSMKFVDRTLERYLRDNISIEKFDLKMDIHNGKSASHAGKWIRHLATKACLKEFSLSITLHGNSYFMLPDELLLGEKLAKIQVRMWGPHCYLTWMAKPSHHPVIKCVSLRELELSGVHISEEALNHIFSSCTLLVKIELLDFESCNNFKTIKIKNLSFLYELVICLKTQHPPVLEVRDVPNLRVFSYNILSRYGSDLLDYDGDLTNLPDPLPFNSNAHSLSLSNVTELELTGVVPDNKCLDMITYGFPFLERLTLGLEIWNSESFHFTCASIKKFTFSCAYKGVSEVQIYAPKLVSFSFHGQNILPDFLFPVSSIRQLKLSLSSIDPPVDVSFFLKMREALTLSPKCDISISTYNDDMPLDIDMEDLRRRLLLPPATNVDQLEFETSMGERQWEGSPFFDAFFEICHPKHVLAMPDTRFQKRFRHKNHFCRLMLREVLEKKTTTAFWPHRLKHVLIRRRPHEKWKTLTNSERCLLQVAAPVYFKLEWNS